MPNPWDNDPIVSSPVLGPPRMPAPQTPDQAVGQSLQNTRTQQEIGAQPLQNANTQTNIEQSKASIGNQRFNQNQGLRQEFNNLPEVKSYSVALQSLGTALKAPDTPQGDLSIIYSYAKAADPGSVVREGEMDMATATASIPQKYQADVARLTQGKRLPSAVRTGLVETMRQSVSGLRQVYDQQRARYGTLAQQNGFDPAEIIGQPLYDAYRPLEEQYIRAHGETPRDPNAPAQEPPKGRYGDGYGASGTQVQFKDEQGNATRARRFHDELYSALSSKQLKSPAQINAWVNRFNSANGGSFSINWNEKDTRIAIRNAMQGKKFGVETPTDPAVQQKIDQYKNQRGTGGSDAYNVGAEDAVTVGAASKIAAAGAALQGSLSGDGSFGDLYNVNLDANREYTDTLRGDHPYAFGAGELTGGLVLPAFGARTPAQLARVGGAYGATYGAMQGDSGTTLTDQAINTAEGGAAGAALGYVAPKALSLIPRRAAKEIPPLVDPATGELNTPMDAMRPADRVQAMRDYGMENISPGMAGGRSARVIEQGLNNVPGSAGVMEDFNSAASRDLRRSMQGVAQQFGDSKTLAEGGAELQRGANARIERGKDVIGRAYSAIPISDTARTSTTNSVATLESLTGRFQSNPELADAMRDSSLVKYLTAIRGRSLSWKDMKDFRSIIGEKIGEMRFGEGSSTSDLRALYGALSQDMRDSAAAQGPRALHAFERANNLYRQNEQLIQGALTRILGKDGNMTPERAAAAVQAMTKGGKGTGDLKMLAQIKAATIKSGAWAEIASTLIHLGGQPANSEGRAFDPRTFVQWYSDMAEPARAMLFKPELRKSLDGFVAMTQQVGRVKGLTNTSNTTPTMIGSGAVAAAGITAVSHPMALVALLGAGAVNMGMAKLWTNPKFVSLITGYGRAAASGNQAAVRSQFGRLSKLAATNPELRAPLVSLLQHIANDNAVPAVAASPNSGGNEQNQ